VAGGAVAARDITDYEGVSSGGSQVAASLGPIDVLVNNAGWDVCRSPTSPADWQKLIAINLTGALNMHHAVLPQMPRRRGGRVANIAPMRPCRLPRRAVCGLQGRPFCARRRWRATARDGITFNVVCPGPTDTQLLGDVLNTSSNPEKLQEAFRRSIPLGRIGTPGDLPGAICFFASEDAAFITGQVLSVSGGLTMAG
jgi:2-hydroxycyclohexanecarboxyl-CoA dehydrogenase